MLQKIKTAMRARVSWVERHFELLLIIAALVAMTLALAIGLQQSVWFDEAYSIFLARQSTDQLLYLTSIDTHPPLYYLLLKGWTALFGFGETALRSLSVVAMGTAVVMAGLLLRRMFTAKIAAIALPFVVFAPMLLRYGFEIRMYAVAMLIGIVATYVLVVALHASRRNQWVLYALYAVLVAAGTLTLYYMVLLWLAHLVWLIWQARREKKPIVRAPWLGALVVGALLFLPWLPVFMSQVTNTALAPVTQALNLDNLMGILSFMFIYQPSWQVGAFLSLVIVLLIIVLAIFFTKVFRLADKQQRSYLVLLALYVLIPIVVLALISLVRPLYLERYLSHVIIGGYMLVGAAIGMLMVKGPSRKLHFISAGVLAVLLIGVVQLVQVGNFNFQRMYKPATSQMVAELADCSPDTTILAADPYIAMELSYYLPDCEIRFYSETAELTGGYAPLSGSPLHVANPATELAASTTLIYIYYNEPTLTMPDTLTAASRQSFGQLQVATFYAEGAS
jgi:4-amino-4-deoxy-L-arabinose transferase-like glycosyltransferase